MAGFSLAFLRKLAIDGIIKNALNGKFNKIIIKLC